MLCIISSVNCTLCMLLLRPWFTSFFDDWSSTLVTIKSWRVRPPMTCHESSGVRFSCPLLSQQGLCGIHFPAEESFSVFDRDSLLILSNKNLKIFIHKASLEKCVNSSLITTKLSFNFVFIFRSSMLQFKGVFKSWVKFLPFGKIFLFN